MQRHRKGILLNGFVDPLLMSELVNDAGYLTESDIAATVVSVTPIEGGTITLPTNDHELSVNLTPLAPLTNLTIVLPPMARLNRRVFVRSSMEIANVTFTCAQPVDNFLAMFSSGDSLVFIEAPTSWSRVV